MAWLDDAISQLMMRMQLQQLMGDNGVFGRTVTDRPPLDNRDQHWLAPGQVPHQGLGEALGPNAFGIYAQAPASDFAVPYMPLVQARENNRQSSMLSQPGYFPGPYGSTRIGDFQQSQQYARPGPGAMLMPSEEVMFRNWLQAGFDERRGR